MALLSSAGDTTRFAETLNSFISDHAFSERAVPIWNSGADLACYINRQIQANLKVISLADYKLCIAVTGSCNPVSSVTKFWFLELCNNHARNGVLLNPQ